MYVRTGSGNFYDGIDFRFNTNVQLARDGRFGKRLINTDYNNFAPRLGIAYSPSRLVVPHRIRRLLLGGEQELDLRFEPRNGRARFGHPDQQGVPTVSYTNFINASQLPVSFAPGLTWGADYEPAHNLHMKYLFNIQRALGSHSTLEVGYTGNQSRKVAMLINANGPSPGITPFASRAPYPEWQAIQFLTGDGIGNYNALSAKLSQRFRDFTTLFSYTWSKALDENSAIRGTGNDFAPEDPHCRACNMGPAGFNVPHRFVASILYNLPFGKGQKFLNHGGLLNQVVGGWQASTITTVQSGASIVTSSWDSAGQVIVPHSNRLHCVGIRWRAIPIPTAISLRRRSPTLWPASSAIADATT